MKGTKNGKGGCAGGIGIPDLLGFLGTKMETCRTHGHEGRSSRDSLET